MRLYEIIGSIVVLATLFSSVGFSGWTYWGNLINDSGFENSTSNILNPYWNLSTSGLFKVSFNSSNPINGTYSANFNNSGYDSGNGYFWQNITLPSDLSGKQININAKVRLEQFCDDTPSLTYKGHLYIQVWDRCQTVDPFYDVGVLVYVKDYPTTTACGLYDLDENFTYSNSSTTCLMTKLKTTNGWMMEMYYGMVSSVDDIFLAQEPTCDGINCGLLNLSIGLSEPADGTRSMSSPIDFSYAVLSNYDILNCSLVTNTNGWSIKQTNSTPVAEGGTLNYFSLSGMATKDTFVWTVACTTAYAPNVQYLGGNRTYIYDPMYAGDVATNILRLAPILLGLFVVMMTFVWVMTRESEEFLSVMLHMFVIYMILAVMLVILFGIL
jgi:hypothetical protein